MKSRPTSPAQHITQVGQISDGLFLVKIGALCQDVSTPNVSMHALQRDIQQRAHLNWT